MSGWGDRLAGLERSWDSRRSRRSAGRTPTHFRIESYGGHGGPAGIVIRGRVLDAPLPTDPVDGERRRVALRRTLRRFTTTELAGVPIQVRIAGAELSTISDEDGYFRVTVIPSEGDLLSPSTAGTVERSEAYRGLAEPYATAAEVLVPGADARFGVISDIDDTILETGVQHRRLMVRRTFFGSALTRTSFAGTPALYRDLAAGLNPVFYVSSSPWNLHGFLLDFLTHQDFPIGPLLLRDLLGDGSGREPKHGRIQEVLDLHPGLPFVLIGDSGEKDPQIYADIVAANPDRILAVFIREVRVDPTDGRVEAVTATWPDAVPFHLVGDSDTLRHHAQALGLL